jgi:PAS domain S-box-containing protein
MASAFHGFRSLIENGPDAISLIDPRGEILYGSAATTKVLGYRPEELVGRNCLDLIHQEDRSRTCRALEELTARPSAPLQWHARFCRSDGTWSWVESTASNLLEEPDVQAIAVNFRDINARRAAESESHRRAEELARSNLRLEEFAYTVAHDLLEPLRTISLHIDVLADGQETAAARQTSKLVVDGAARMKTLIEDLFSFASSGRQEQLQSVGLGNALAQALQNLAGSIQACGAVVTFDELPVVRTCEIHLVRVFQNLISNALKYRSGNPVRIHVTANRHGPLWVIKTSDNGVGIAPEYQDRVFLPFTRLASRDIPGTGLGLAVCKKTLEALGGTIWIESKLGAGSTFCFTLAAGQDIPAPGIAEGPGDVAQPA